MKGSEVALTINGVLYEVPDSLPAVTTLLDFIRDHVKLKGTKFMCREGGCGSCIVTVKKKDAATGQDVVISVNSCLRPIFACHGWSVTTIEGIGSKQTGYNEVQSRLARYNGTQCGYCSPGMVMNMYSLLKGQKKVSKRDIEHAFGGNTCRCTGYRPILDAFKSFSNDQPNDCYPELCKDIEDFLKVCPKTEKICEKVCHVSKRCHPDEDFDEDYDFLFADSFVCNLTNNIKWYKVDSTKQIFEVFDLITDSQTYKLAAGSTAQGVYRDGKIDFFIDITGIAALSDWVLSAGNLSLGANVTLTKTIDIFRKVIGQDSNFHYLEDFIEHIKLVAHTSVRNVGTLAGNLNIKNQHNQFPSDIYLMFVTVGALFSYETDAGFSDTEHVEDLISFDLRKKLLTSFILPALDSSHVVKTYKIMPCAQNAIAIVNAGFHVKLNRSEGSAVVAETPTIVYGGISPGFVRARQTENFLTGKNLSDTQVIQEALNILDQEVKPNEGLLLTSPEYRKGLAKSLFYKFILNLFPTTVNERYQSGGELLYREVSSGTQSFDTDPSKYPVNKPIPKLEAFQQCSGEAQYVNDIPSLPEQLYGALVLAPKGPGKLDSINTDEALKIRGVRAFFSAKDIPGVNSFVTIEPLFYFQLEPLFADKSVLYAGQPVGIIIAIRQSLADKAARTVKVNVTMVEKPLLTTKDVLASGDITRIFPFPGPIPSLRRSPGPMRMPIPITGQVPVSNPIPEGTFERIQAEGVGTRIITGSFEIGLQYHYHMETQTCLVIPTEEGLDVYPSCQYISFLQRCMAKCLRLPENCINVQCKRVGGAYGGKISRNNQVTLACGVAAYHLRKPVRMIMTQESNMRAIGKRPSVFAEYNVVVAESGKILVLTMKFFEDQGCSPLNEAVAAYTLLFIANCYDSIGWVVVGNTVRTDTASNTAMRAPGGAPGIAIIEHVIEHIAFILNKDPIDVRTINLKNKHKDKINSMIAQLKQSSDFDRRKEQIKKFNEKNRWRKKGISLSLMNFTLELVEHYHALVSIYQSDGTVSITHGGIEMGQGINTKVAQVCAYKFGIDISMIKIKPTNVLTAPNDSDSEGSQTSETVCLAVINCCDQLLARISPIRENLGNDVTWQVLIAAAAAKDIDLCATYMANGGPAGFLSSYPIYGVCAAEVEVDLLTGNLLVWRVDILEDVGTSLSPEIDIGQVEGAFVMGLGWWLTEEIILDPCTGCVLTNRSWNYKPPGPLDIPIDFRVGFVKNSPNPIGVLGSKATGEPATCLSVCVAFALKEAINAARVDAGKQREWLEIRAPYSPEKLFLAAFNGTQDYKLQ